MGSSTGIKSPQGQSSVLGRIWEYPTPTLNPFLVPSALQNPTCSWDKKGAVEGGKPFLLRESPQQVLGW